MANELTQVLGIVAISNKGEYNSQTDYEKLNVVTYNGSSYCAKQNCRGVLPTNPDYWQLYAQKGETGDIGPQGPLPVKGVDYFTEEDREEFSTEIQSDVFEEVSQQVGNLTSGKPLVASSVSDMSDTTRIYVNITDGNWYYYNGSAWTIGGVYQSTVGITGFYTKSRNLMPLLNVSQFTYRGLTIKIENGLLYLNGTSTGSVYLRLTNTFAYGASANAIGDSEDLADFVVGKPYQLITNLLQGTISYPPEAAVPAASGRNSDNTIALTRVKDAMVLEKTVNRIQYYLPSDATFNNVILSIGAYATDRDLNKNNVGQYKLGGIEIPSLDELIDNLSYKTFKVVSNEEIHRDYMNNTDQTMVNTVITQGMCGDDERYIWYTTWDRGNTSTIDDKLCYLHKYDTQTNTIVAQSTTETAHVLGHANGMCYNPNDNCLYIVALNEDNTIHKVNADTLALIESFNISRDNIPNRFSAIAFNKDLNKYVALIAKFGNYRAFAFYDTNWNLEKLIKIDGNANIPYLVNSTNATSGGIYTDDKFIYLTFCNVFDGTETDYNWNGYIYVYDYNGNFVFRYAVPYHHEVENICKIGEDFYLNYNTNTHRYAVIEKVTPIIYTLKLKSDVTSQYNMN